jgi:TonB family protein
LKEEIMNAELLYQPQRRWLIWIAFVCATGIHLAAVVIAENRSDRAGLPDLPPAGVDIDIVEDDTTQPTQEPEMVTPLEQLTANDEEAFPSENPTPPPIRPRKKVAVARLVREAATGAAKFGHFGSAKTLAVYAPRPVYPYEARRDRVTGSGLVLLIVDGSSGNVIEARMAQSTGSAILDNSAVSACRTWRFKPGTVTRVQVPITYTLYGVWY